MLLVFLINKIKLKDTKGKHTFCSMFTNHIRMNLNKNSDIEIKIEIQLCKFHYGLPQCFIIFKKYVCTK